VADTFFGNYRATPFGIHRDPASVFSFVLQGRRTYCFWPMSHFASDDPDLYRTDPEVLARHLDHAERFEAGPGDLIYWPSNRWHVILADGHPFVAAQVSAYFRPEDVGQAEVG
jgi:50S ribosomal protein L16 3-hydroxylase